MFVRLESPSGATSLCQRLPVSIHYIIHGKCINYIFKTHMTSFQQIFIEH